MKKYRIAVAGIGYVGLSNAILLSQNNDVVAVDVISEKVEAINKRKSPIADEKIIEYLEKKPLSLRATVDWESAYSNAEYVIVATPTDYDEERDYFNTTLVEDVIGKVCLVNKEAVIVIKSTVPIGFTRRVHEKYPTAKVFFSPEFLREGKALTDNLYPSRIVIGTIDDWLIDEAKIFANLLVEGALKEDIKVIFANSTEAEAVKLFSNTYLAMRVAFFNELDIFAETKKLCTRQIIEAMAADPRIGDDYCNPSFGYGGYCLPKDTKQMVANFGEIPNDLIKAIVNSNQTRKAFITEKILEKIDYNNNRDSVVGIFRLTMKADSDNFRSAAIIGIINSLLIHGVNVLIYEPTIKSDSFNSIEVEHDFESFVNRSDIIVANRMERILDRCSEKVYTRDVFEEC